MHIGIRCEKASCRKLDRIIKVSFEDSKIYIRKKNDGTKLIYIQYSIIHPGSIYSSGVCPFTGGRTSFVKSQIYTITKNNATIRWIPASISPLIRKQFELATEDTFCAAMKSIIDIPKKNKEKKVIL